jgi:hypothetical protein
MSTGVVVVVMADDDLRDVLGADTAAAVAVHEDVEAGRAVEVGHRADGSSGEASHPLRRCAGRNGRGGERHDRTVATGTPR